MPTRTTVIVPPLLPTVPVAPRPFTSRRSIEYDAPSVSSAPFACTEGAARKASRAWARISSADASARSTEAEAVGDAPADGDADADAADDAAARPRGAGRRRAAGAAGERRRGERGDGGGGERAEPHHAPGIATTCAAGGGERGTAAPYAVNVRVCPAPADAGPVTRSG